MSETLAGIMTITVTMVYASFAVYRGMRTGAAVAAGLAMALGADSAFWLLTNQPTMAQAVFDTVCVLLGVWAFSLVCKRNPESMDERAEAMNYDSPWDDLPSPLDFGILPFSSGR